MGRTELLEATILFGSTLDTLPEKSEGAFGELRTFEVSGASGRGT